MKATFISRENNDVKFTIEFSAGKNLKMLRLKLISRIKIGFR